MGNTPKSMNNQRAAYHEAAHAVVGMALGMLLQDAGLHIDKVNGRVGTIMCLNLSW